MLQHGLNLNSRPRRRRCEGRKEKAVPRSRPHFWNDAPADFTDCRTPRRGRQTRDTSVSGHGNQCGGGKSSRDQLFSTSVTTNSQSSSVLHLCHVFSSICNFAFPAFKFALLLTLPVFVTTALTMACPRHSLVLLSIILVVYASSGLCFQIPAQDHGKGEKFCMTLTWTAS